MILNGGPIDRTAAREWDKANTSFYYTLCWEVLVLLKKNQDWKAANIRNTYKERENCKVFKERFYFLVSKIARWCI